jgi:hypothetical protein
MHTTTLIKQLYVAALMIAIKTKKPISTLRREDNAE